MRTKLYEILKKRINKTIINEEFGISNELDSKTREAYRKIMKQYDNKPFINENGLTFREWSVSIDFFGYELLIKTTEYAFETEDEYNSYMQQGNRIGGYRSLRFPVEVSLFRVDDDLLTEDFIDTLGHELEHAYQDVKTGKSTAKLLSNMIKERLFNYAPFFLYSPNDAERHVARCIYACCPKEQDAFINGLFQNFQSNPLRNPDMVIKNSEAVAWLENLYESYSYVCKHKDDEAIKNALNNYFKKEVNSSKKGINDRKSFDNSNQFIKFIQNGIKRYEWKLSRVVYFCKKKYGLYDRPTPKGKNINEVRYNPFLLL